MNKIPTDEEIRYEIAQKRVKELKGFYIHLVIYIVINIIILIGNYQFWNKSGSFFSWNNFSVAFFWGIWLVAHALSVFGLSVFLGNKWEEKKIKKIMDKENGNKWE